VKPRLATSPSSAWSFGFALHVETALPASPARISVLARRGGAQAIARSCSRMVAVAEVVERRLVLAPKSHGSSPLAPTLTRASSGGERAPEAGSRWREPRAREQCNRWRAPRDPTRRRASVRRARGREHSAMEGVLGRRTPASLTRRRQSRSRRSEVMGKRVRQRCRTGDPLRARQRTSEARSRARHAVDNTASGRCSAEEPTIGLRQDRASPHTPAAGAQAPAVPSGQA